MGTDALPSGKSVLSLLRATYPPTYLPACLPADDGGRRLPVGPYLPAFGGRPHRFDDLITADLQVVAIDPAEMDGAVAALPEVLHLRCKCEDAVDSGQLLGALAARGRAQVPHHEPGARPGVGVNPRGRNLQHQVVCAFSC